MRDDLLQLKEKVETALQVIEGGSGHYYEGAKDAYQLVKVWVDEMLEDAR